MVNMRRNRASAQSRTLLYVTSMRAARAKKTNPDVPEEPVKFSSKTSSINKESLALFLSSIMSSYLGSIFLVFLLTILTLAESFVSRPLGDQPRCINARRDSDNDHGQGGIEYSALVRGQPISVQVGDVSLARKAWKKRRRTDSPILVPCTILDIDLSAALRFSILHLVHAFGRNLRPIQQAFPYPNGDGQLVGDGVTLPLSSLPKLYKMHFKGDLIAHCENLHKGDILSLVQHLFDPVFQDDLGISVQQIDSLDGTKVAYLTSTLSHRPARKSVKEDMFLQFVSPISRINHDQLLENKETKHMAHTGYTVLTQSVNSTRIDHNNPVLLSAALKISQADAESQRIKQGMILDAFVLSFDTKGDNEAPLLTCAFSLPNSIIRDQMRRRYHNKHVFAMRTLVPSVNELSGHYQGSPKPFTKVSLVPTLPSSDPKFQLVNADKNYTIRDLSALCVGDGPFRATVMRVVSSRKRTEHTHADAPVAFVDLGVSRKRGKKNGGGRARVYGMLVVEKELNVLDHEEYDNDEEEDISAFYSLDDSGNLISLHDSKNHAVYEENDDMDDGSDDFSVLKSLNAMERLKYIGKIMDQNNPSTLSSQNDSDYDQYHIGDEIDVYIKAIFLQSGRFIVTQDANIKNTKYALIKKQKEAEKRLNRLSSKVSLSQIMNNIGEECVGFVKAKSKSGSGYYVQPENDQNGFWTAGLAQPISSNCERLTQGRRVRIRLEGIDEERGQLSYSLLGPAEDM